MFWLYGILEVIAVRSDELLLPVNVDLIIKIIDI